MAKRILASFLIHVNLHFFIEKAIVVCQGEWVNVLLLSERSLVVELWKVHTRQSSSGYSKPQVSMCTCVVCAAAAGVYMMARALDESPLGDEEHTARVKKRLDLTSQTFYDFKLDKWALNLFVCYERWDYVYEKGFAPKERGKYDDFRNLLIFLSELAGHSEWKENRVYDVNVGSVVENHVRLPTTYLRDTMLILRQEASSRIWHRGEEKFKALIKNAVIATLHSGLTLLSKRDGRFWRIVANNAHWVGEDVEGQKSTFYEILIDYTLKPPRITELNAVKKPNCPHDFLPMYLDAGHDNAAWTK